MAPTITPYDFTNITNSSQNSFIALIQFTSTSTNYVPGLVILLMITLVLFFSLILRGTTVTKSFAAAVWVNMIIAIPLFALRIISAQMFTVSIVLVPLSFLALWLFESGP